MKSFSVVSARTVSVNGDWSDIEEDTEDLSSNCAGTTTKAERKAIRKLRVLALALPVVPDATIAPVAQLELLSPILFTIQISFVVHTSDETMRFEQA